MDGRCHSTGGWSGAACAGVDCDGKAEFQAASVKEVHVVLAWRFAEGGKARGFVGHHPRFCTRCGSVVATAHLSSGSQPQASSVSKLWNLLRFQLLYCCCRQSVYLHHVQSISDGHDVISATTVWLSMSRFTLLSQIVTAR